MECFGTYFTHVQSFDVTHNGAHNGPDSAKTDVMRKTRTLHALLLRAAENQCFTTTRASFCVCTPLKFRYGFFRSVQDKIISRCGKTVNFCSSQEQGARDSIKTAN